MSAVKLASGYIELTVKKAGNAMKEITTEITNVGKQAEKVGKQAGEAISDGITKGAKGAGKTVQDEITSAAEKAGEDAGKKAGDAISKGVTKGAKEAGKTVQDEITKAAKKASDDVSQTKIEPKVDTSGAKGAIKDLGRDILDSVRQGARDAGVDLDKELTKAAGRVGANIGKAIGDSPLGAWLHDLGIDGDQAVESLGRISDVIGGIKNKDLTGTLTAAAGALKLFGQNDAASAVQSVATQAQNAQTQFTLLKSAIGDGAGVLKTFAGTAEGTTGKLGALADAASKAAGPIALAYAGMQQLDKLAAEVNQKYFNGQRVLPDAGVPGTPFWFLNRTEAALNGKGLAAYNPFDTSPDTAGHGLPGTAPPSPPVQGPRPYVAPPSSSDYHNWYGGGQPATQNAPAIDFYSQLPQRARGGVTPTGRIFGPGTGTSDSILGISADGIPTAMVSNGEGVVRKSAMDRGGDRVVAALNAGLGLPGYDDGTTNVGGDAPVIPPIKVPEATTGGAGDFNAWLSQQQGKAYQYGTLYDCSGFMSQIYNRITGQQMPRFNTESDLAAYGFVRGTQPGTFQLGIHHGGGGPNSHMAGTLPDGRNVESAGNGVQIGAGAHGALDKQFEDHWFLPGSAGFGGGQPVSAGAVGPRGMDGAGDVAPTSADQSPASADRKQGYIPAGAGSSGHAGSSLASGLLRMGSQAINGLIDQASSAAATAVSAGITAGSFGAGAAGGGQAGAAAAQFAIGLGTQAAKRGVSYGFQMAGIAADAIPEILMPFGVPRFFQTDPTQFMPQLPNRPTAATTGEKAALQKSGEPGSEAPNLQPGGPVQPGQLPGQQPVGAPVQEAQAGGVPSAPLPIAGLVPKPTTPQADGQAPPAPAQGSIAVQPNQTPQIIKPTDLGGLLGANGLARGGVVPRVFDNGGWLMPGAVAINQTKRPEPILNDNQWGTLQAIAGQSMPAPDPSAGGAYAPDYSVRIDSVTVKDVNELQREIDSRQRLQMMRHAGRP